MSLDAGLRRWACVKPPLWFSIPGGNPSLVHSIMTSASGLATGDGFRMAASTMLKIAVFAPQPTASETTTASASTGVRRS